MKTCQTNISRRNFLALSSAIPASLLAQSTVGDLFAAPAESPGTAAKKYPIGLELYSVRNELMRNLPDTLRTVAKIGYEVVEFYAPYFDWSIPRAKEVRTVLEDSGLRCYSTHNSFNSFTDAGMPKAIEINQILGCNYLILSSAPGSVRGVTGWKKLCEQLTTAVDQLKPHGLSAGFHNHNAEWAKLDGDQRVMDIIAAGTPKEFLLQFDVGTCVEAGQDPVAWVKANPGRIKSAHLKEWAPGSRGEEKGFRTLFGEGVTPWKELIAALESDGGVEYYLMEQEVSRFPEFETAQRCLDAWKKMRSQG